MEYKLYMLLLGCTPAGRNIEQHDIFFGVAKELKDLIPQIKSFWKEAGKIHLDGWRQVNNVDGFQISITKTQLKKPNGNALFFINLGGYKENEFEEFHYKILSVAADKSKAIYGAKQSAFFKHTGFGKVANAHIDDKYGVDVDDIFEITDILPAATKEKFSINISTNKIDNLPEDIINLGYFKLDSL